MTRKFKNNVKYKKKNFNIYQRFNLKFVKKSQIYVKKASNLKFNDLSNNQKNKFHIEKQGFWSKIFDDFFKM